MFLFYSIVDQVFVSVYWEGVYVFGPEALFYEWDAALSDDDNIAFFSETVEYLLEDYADTLPGFDAIFTTTATRAGPNSFDFHMKKASK